MRNKLDATLPPAKEPGLPQSDLAARFYLARRGVPDDLMTLVRGAVAEAIQQGNEQVTLADLARVYESKPGQQRVLGKLANPFIGKPDTGALDRVRPRDGRGFGNAVRQQFVFHLQIRIDAAASGVASGEVARKSVEDGEDS